MVLVSTPQNDHVGVCDVVSQWSHDGLRQEITCQEKYKRLSSVPSHGGGFLAGSAPGILGQLG